MPNQNGRQFHRTVRTMVKCLAGLRAVRKLDLRIGDGVSVQTRNSTYSIRVLGDDLYSVSGGWFDRKGVSPMKTTITGCTWGGRAIKEDLLAARGLYLEFGNQVVTTGSNRWMSSDLKRWTACADPLPLR